MITIGYEKFAVIKDREDSARLNTHYPAGVPYWGSTVRVPSTEELNIQSVTLNLGIVF